MMSPMRSPRQISILKTAKLLKISPSDCLVFEDAPNGVKAGKAAGMLVYGINSEEEIGNKLKKEHADYIAKSLTEIEV